MLWSTPLAPLPLRLFGAAAAAAAAARFGLLLGMPRSRPLLPRKTTGAEARGIGFEP